MGLYAVKGFALVLQDSAAAKTMGQTIIALGVMVLSRHKPRAVGYETVSIYKCYYGLSSKLFTDFVHHGLMPLSRYIFLRVNPEQTSGYLRSWRTPQPFGRSLRILAKSINMHKNS